MKISVLIPVLNESKSILLAVNRLSDFDEIVVIDGDSKQGTVSALKNIPKVKTAYAARGRGSQLATGAKMITGDAFIVLHVDTLLPNSAYSLVKSAVKSGVEYGAFDLTIAASGLIYRLIEFGASLRSRFNGLPFGDQAQFFSTAFYHRIGGFSEIPIMEDIDIMERAKEVEGKFCVFQQPVATSPRRWEKHGPIRTTLKNWKIQYFYKQGVDPVALYNQYYQKNKIDKFTQLNKRDRHELLRIK